MAAQTPIWIKIPWQQCPVMHRMEDLHYSAINKGKGKNRKVAICLPDPARQVVFLTHMASFLLTRGWAGLNPPLLKQRKTKHGRNILDVTETRCTNLIGSLLFEQFFHISILRKCCEIQVSVFIRQRGSESLNGREFLSQRKVKRRMLTLVCVWGTAERNQKREILHFL